MTAEHDMQDLTADDLDSAHARLYFTARAYCLVTEQGMLQTARHVCADHDPQFVSVGGPAAELVEAAQRYAEAYDRWLAHLPPEGDDDTREHES